MKSKIPNYASTVTNMLKFAIANVHKFSFRNMHKYAKNMYVSVLKYTNQ